MNTPEKLTVYAQRSCVFRTPTVCTVPPTCLETACPTCRTYADRSTFGWGVCSLAELSGPSVRLGDLTEEKRKNGNPEDRSQVVLCLSK